MLPREAMVDLPDDSIGIDAPAPTPEHRERIRGPTAAPVPCPSLGTHSRLALAVSGSALLGAAVLKRAGARLWKRGTAEAVRNLTQTILPVAARPFSLDQLEGLPEPVARYFRYSLTPGQSLIQAAVIEHVGHLRLGGFGSPWHSLRAVQHYSFTPPGIVGSAPQPFLEALELHLLRATRRGTYTEAHPRLPRIADDPSRTQQVPAFEGPMLFTLRQTGDPEISGP
jgi:hypothetical protein